MIHHCFIAALLTSLFTLFACTDPEYSDVDLRQVSDAPSEVFISDRQIRLPEGIAVEIRANVNFKGDKYYSGDYFHLAARDSDILGVSPISAKLFS